MKKKEWKAPTIVTISSKELKKHIQAAARSGVCYTWGK